MSYNNPPAPQDQNGHPFPPLVIKNADGTYTFVNATTGLPIGSLPASENHIGAVGGRLKRASAEFTRPADTTGYIARDVVSNSTGGSTLMEFDLARVAGGSGYLIKARIITSNKTPTPRFRLWLYTTGNPTVAVDNAQMTLLWANRANRIGFLDFPAVATEDATNSDSASALYAARARRASGTRRAEVLHAEPTATRLECASIPITRM